MPIIQDGETYYSEAEIRAGEHEKYRPCDEEPVKPDGSLYGQILAEIERELECTEDISSRVTGNKEDIKTIEDYMFKLEDRIEKLERAVVKLISL